MNSSLIDASRLADTFQQLVRIDSISKEEGQLVQMLRPILDDLGAETVVDGAGDRVGGKTGNLIARFYGNREVAPMLFSAHMDTVEPGRGVQPVFKDGIFSSDGSKILGADDKSAIAVLLEVFRVLTIHDLPHGPIDLVLTICEEIGLLGAKHMDFQYLRARFGYVLDSRYTDAIVVRAPSANGLNSSSTAGKPTPDRLRKRASMPSHWRPGPSPVLIWAESMKKPPATSE